MDSGSLSWRGRLEHEIQRWAGDASSLAYARANAAAIGETISGKKPDSNRIAPEIGAHAVANIPAVHVPSFVQLSIDGDPKPYKNGYDLGTYHLGEPAPGEALRTRVLVDQALPVGPPESIYFCAVELNGQGIRFFGDICLVLKPGSLSNPEVLERNSYDVTRAPVAAEIDAYPLGQDRDDARAEQLGRWAGSWDRDLGAITARKVLQNWGGTVRRMTTGQISRELLDDEDYIEVLKVGSFGASDVQEARVSAADAALDASVGDRLRRGPTPAFQSLLWRHYRRKAEKALRTVGIRTHVVTTLGRTR